MENNKRKHQRKSVEFNALYSIDNGKDDLYDASIANMSEAGLCLRTGKIAKRDDPLIIIITIENHQRVKVHAKVAWCQRADPPHPHTLGVEIVDPVDNNFDLLLDMYIREIRVEQSEELPETVA